MFFELQVFLIELTYSWHHVSTTHILYNPISFKWRL